MSLDSDIVVSVVLIRVYHVLQLFRPTLIQPVIYCCRWYPTWLILLPLRFVHRDLPLLTLRFLFRNNPATPYSCTPTRLTEYMCISTTARPAIPSSSCNCTS